METVLGLIGLFLYITGMLALSAGVTYLVIRLTPDRAAKPKPPEPET